MVGLDMRWYFTTGRHRLARCRPSFLPIEERVEYLLMEGGWMPEISRFFGIVIAMYCDDHPPPHFHAIYGSDRAEFCIDPIGILKGRLPPRALALVTEWAALHQAELLDAWDQRGTGQTPRKIEPLR